jgi:hypothetical protein
MPLLSAGRAKVPIDLLATPCYRSTHRMWGTSRQMASGLTATARLIRFLSTLFPSGLARLVPVTGFDGVESWRLLLDPLSWRCRCLHGALCWLLKSFIRRFPKCHVRPGPPVAR